MNTENTQFSLKAAREALQHIDESGDGRAWRLVVRKHTPGGMSGHGTVEVKGIYPGMDHYAGRVIIETEVPLTALTPEQVEDISKSIRAGQSWHAYEAQKKLQARIAELESMLLGLSGGAAVPADPQDAELLGGARRRRALSALSALTDAGWTYAGGKWSQPAVEQDKSCTTCAHREVVVPGQPCAGCRADGRVTYAYWQQAATATPAAESGPTAER